ncbi:MAG: hypothetical protein JXB49_36595, partial [Bacteroidales bacterium]|nr:hypothetical protein [Bacteroidales bacterium]
CLLAVNNLTAQKNADKVLEKEYQLEFQFTGEVSPQLDSTFLVYCVFDLKDMSDIKSIQIKRGNKRDLLISEDIDLSNPIRVQKRDKKMYIKIGKSDVNAYNIEVYTEDNSGLKSKAKLKVK